MLKLFAEGTIKLFEKRDTWVDWEDKSKGRIPQYLYYIQTEDDKGQTDVFQVKGKEDFSKLVDIPSVFTLGFWSMDRRAGLVLIEAKAMKTGS